MSRLGGATLSSLGLSFFRHRAKISPIKGKSIARMYYPAPRFFFDRIIHAGTVKMSQTKSNFIMFKLFIYN